MKSSLPNSVTTKLLELVKNRPYIWNTKHEMYNDRYLVATGWREIQEELQQPEPDLRMKWRNVRDVFKKEIKKHPCNSVDEYTGKWQYFKATFFLHAENQADYNDDNISDQDNNEYYAEEEVSIDIPEGLTETQHNEIKIEFQDEETDNAEVFNDTIEKQLPAKKLKRQNPAYDYDLLYLRSLVPYFSHLDPMRKLVLRSKLQDILYKELAEQEQCNVTKRSKVT